MPGQGDLPDWQTLTSPDYINISSFDPGAGTSTPLISMSTPFRIWAVWLTIVATTNASYTGGGFAASARLVEANNAVLIAATVNPTKASDHDSTSNSLTFYGYVSSINLSTYSLIFKVDTVPANAFIHASCGVIVSEP